MNRPEKILTLILIGIITTSAFFFGSITNPTSVHSVQHFEIWINVANETYAVNQTIVVYVETLWTIERIAKVTNKLYESKNASEIFQWAIDRSNEIRIDKGQYILNETLVVRPTRYLRLVFDLDSDVTSTAIPIISITNDTRG